MCYNCGCGQPDDDMGMKRVSEGGGALTNQDFQKLADAWGMSVEEAKRNTLDLLQKELGK